MTIDSQGRNQGGEANGGPAWKMLPAEQSLKVSRSLTSKLGSQALLHLPPAPKHCVCCFGFKTSNKSCFVLWGLPICLHLLSWQLCSSPGPRLAQLAREGGEKSGRLQAERALISTCFTFHTLHGNSKSNPMGLFS